MAKKKKTYREEEPMDVFEIVRIAMDAKREKETAKRWAAKSVDERHEYRGAVMAAGSFFRCLGDPAEEWAGDDYLSRVQGCLLECIQKGRKGDGPRPLRYGRNGGGAIHERLWKKKYFSRACKLNLPMVYCAKEGRVTLVDFAERPSFLLGGSAIATHFVVCMGVGLFSDMAYSAAAGEYVYLHPEWEGRYFSYESAALPLDAPARLDLKVELPFKGGLPEGLHLVGSVSVMFYSEFRGQLGRCGGGGMEGREVGRVRSF